MATGITNVAKITSRINLKNYVYTGSTLSNVKTYIEDNWSDLQKNVINVINCTNSTTLLIVMSGLNSNGTLRTGYGFGILIGYDYDKIQTVKAVNNVFTWNSVGG